jgi:hypothetical protein
MYRHIGKLAAIAAFVGGLAACTSPTAPASNTQSVSARQAEPGDVRHEPEPGDVRHEPEPGDKHLEPEPGDKHRGRGSDDPAGHH